MIRSRCSRAMSSIADMLILLRWAAANMSAWRDLQRNMWKTGLTPLHTPPYLDHYCLRAWYLECARLFRRRAHAFQRFASVCLILDGPLQYCHSYMSSVVAARSLAWTKARRKQPVGLTYFLAAATSRSPHARRDAPVPLCRTRHACEAALFEKTAALVAARNLEQLGRLRRISRANRANR